MWQAVDGNVAEDLIALASVATAATAM